MTARTILTTFFIAFVLAEAKWHKPRREATSVCDAIYKHRGKIVCYCMKDNIRPEIIRSAECYLTDEKVKQSDHIWQMLDSLKSTTRLILSNNRNIPLRYVPTQALSYLDGLLEIEVKQANIETIPPFAFANSTNVEDISLRGNQIKVLEKYAFAHHRDLAVIKLDKNNIGEINRDVFVDLPMIEKLFLTDNVITIIHDGAFAHLGTLRELEINMNQLYSLNGDTFDGLTNLLRLDLSSNNLQVIGENTFSALSSLQYLNLEENKIQMLDEKAFSGLRKLQHLSLAHNELSSLQNDLVFVELISLRTLNLRGNELKELKAKLMEPLLENFYESGSYLDVEDNLFPCNCKLDWFLVLMNRTSSKSLKITLENIKCVPDAELKEKWASLQEAEKLPPLTDEVQTGADYEYYDDSQLNGNLFYTDVRDLIGCKVIDKLIPAPSRANQVSATTATSRATNITISSDTDDSTAGSSATSTTHDVSSTSSGSSTTSTSHTVSSIPASTKHNTASYSRTTENSQESIKFLYPLKRVVSQTQIPTTELNTINEINASRKSEIPSTERAITERSTVKLIYHKQYSLHSSQYDNNKNMNEGLENINSYKNPPVYSTEPLVSVSAKPDEKILGVYDNMAADEAKPDNSNAPVKGKQYPNSAHQNVGCVALIALICTRLFH